MQAPCAGHPRAGLPRPTSRTHLQEIIYSVTRDQDEKQYNLQVGQRVFVSLEAKSLMGFEMHEIESSPLTAPAAH